MTLKLIKKILGLMRSKQIYFNYSLKKLYIGIF